MKIKYERKKKLMEDKIVTKKKNNLKNDPK
jgi:hypothetical protein